jgi:hypothetical protein
MDINYLMARQQIALIKAAAAPTRLLRVTHEAFAQTYGRALAEIAFPPMDRKSIDAFSENPDRGFAHG